jgi:hypothetical protein
MESTEGMLFRFTFSCIAILDLNISSLIVLSTFQHFFGGAMSVFTTRALLNSVGVSQSRATSGAVAINWILKVKCSFRCWCRYPVLLVIWLLSWQFYCLLLLQDGAGRVGKMLFARQGKKFDCDLKQVEYLKPIVCSGSAFVLFCFSRLIEIKICYSSAFLAISWWNWELE